MGAMDMPYTFVVIFITKSPWLKDESVLICQNLFPIKTTLNYSLNVFVLYIVNEFVFSTAVGLIPNSDNHLCLACLERLHNTSTPLSVTLLVLLCLIMVACLQSIGILAYCSELIWGWK